ncbi:MAG: nuclear transport factor 2 family protein [Solirubrobacteraceae bacterium]
MSRRRTLGGDDKAIRAALADLLVALDPDAEYELRHDDFVADMPQSDERIRGRDAMRELQRAFPAESRPTFTVRRISGTGETWTVEAEGDYGGPIFYVVLIVELRDGKIARETRYYAEPFEAPQWRAHLVERRGDPERGASR